MFLYLILAGIVQGCPSAGSCFAIAADPFFYLLACLQDKFPAKSQKHSHLQFRGCADDIGAAIASYKFLKVIKPVFDQAEKFAGLKLNLRKCIIVPAKFSSFEAKKVEIHKWLCKFLPGWQEFKILPSAPYLGPAIGPAAGDDMWAKPVAKYWERVLRIANCNLSAYYAVLAYNSYAVSCLEYLCQMYWAPPSLLRLESRAIAKILKIPAYAFSVDGPFKLKEYGVLSCRSIVALNCAALFRASRTTLEGWQAGWQLLLHSCKFSSLDDCIAPSMSTPEWNSIPITARLFTAFNGFRDNHLQCIPLPFLAKLKPSFHKFSFLIPSGPVLSTSVVAPIDDPIFKRLYAVFKNSKGKPQRGAYEIFKEIVHPQPFPQLMFLRASRWLHKYFEIELSFSTIEKCMAIIKKCSSPFVASLIVRTLAYAWTTGVRFTHSVTDRGRCPFCDCPPETLPHILCCKALLLPLRDALNSELRSRGLLYVLIDFSSDDANGILRKIIPSSPASPCCLLILAAACDMFHAAKNVTFLSKSACNGFIKSRAHIFAQKLGHKFWKKLSSEFPRPPQRLKPRRSHTPQRSATSLFCSSSLGPPPSGLGKGPSPGLSSLVLTNLGQQCPVKKQHEYNTHGNMALSKHPSKHFNKAVACCFSFSLSFWAWAVFERVCCLVGICWPFLSAVVRPNLRRLRGCSHLPFNIPAA